MTPHRRRPQIDAFLRYIALTGAAQLAYAAAAGTTFPLNSLVAGVTSCAGMYVLTMALRMQVAGGKVSAHRAYADYAAANLVLHLAVLNFMG